MGIQKSIMCFTVSNPRRTALKDDLADRSSDLIKSKEGIAKLENALRNIIILAKMIC